MSENFTLSSLITGPGVAGKFSGVSIITQGPATGHGLHIDAVTLDRVKACADKFKGGVRVQMDHGSGFNGIVGVLTNFRIDGEKLRGDLQLLKSHPQFSQVVEVLETLSDSVGLSISFSGTKEEIGGEQFARPTELYSIDLVTEPATNRGLFSKPQLDSGTNDMDTPSISTFDRVINLFKSSEDTVRTELATMRVDLATSKSQATKLTADLAAKVVEFETIKTEFEKAKVDHAAALAKLPALAATQAQTIVAQLGVPAITTTPGALAGATGLELKTQLAAITDPVLRTEFVNKNYEAIKAQSNLERRAGNK